MSKTLSDLVRVYRRRRAFPGNVTFPHVRKVWPKSLAQEIVSVQPMSLPSGLLFYMDFLYGSGSQPQE